MATEYTEDRAAECGYREVSGKAVRLAEWAWRKEKRAFAKLANTLVGYRWRERVRAAGGVLADRLRARNRVWMRAARYAEYTRAPRIVTCRGCDAAWCAVLRKGGRALVWCSDACWRAQRWHVLDDAAREALNAKRRARRARPGVR